MEAAMSVRSRLWLAGLAGVLLLAAPAGQISPALNASQAQARVTVVGSVVNATLTPLAGVVVTLEQNGRVTAKTTTDAKGTFRIADVAAGDYIVKAELKGFPVLTRELKIPAGMASITLPIVLARPEDTLENKMVAVDRMPQGQAASRGAGAAAAGAPPPPAYTPPAANTATAAAGGTGGGRGGTDRRVAPYAQNYGGDYARPPYYAETGEAYAPIDPNRFQSTRERPLSTFGADVDTASYTNVRRFLSSGQLPPRDAVRVEELINYFDFSYPAPRDGRPISLTAEIGDCPWAPSHKLVLIGARAAASSSREITGRNIVLLIDVSGSMAPRERLPLIKTALGMFVDTLRARDTLSIVTYAGTSGVALRPTPAARRDTIQQAIDRLNANGSTNGGQGLITAYRIAREAFIPGGINRVILATDGDFNVGITSQRDLLDLIERERSSGVFLSVFGVGSGNLKDSTMEMLADRGNGRYAYLDSFQEARRVLIREADATLDTVAKDVKFQVEFNPAIVSSWKLIGYENRALAARDFNNDRKDAGDVGAGDTVTVLYEIIPAGADRGDDAESRRPDVDPLRYQPAPRAPRGSLPIMEPSRQFSGEWLNVKARYKLPDDEESRLMTLPVRASGRVQHLPLASAVAEYGLLLRDRPADERRWDALLRRVERLPAAGPRASDVDGFKELVAIGKGLSRLRR
jgi:Ca-activated chloride channel family protein